MGGRKRRRPPSPSPSSVERSPQSIEPGAGTAPVTRSRSRAARSGLAPTVPQELESSGSRSTRPLSSARSPRSMPQSVAAPSSPGGAAAGDSIGAQLVNPAPPSASTAGGKEPASASSAGGDESAAPASTGPRSMPQSVAAPSSLGEAVAGDSIGAQLVNPTPTSASTAGGKEPASASTAGGDEFAAPGSTAGGDELAAPASPAGEEGEEVDPMLEPEDTADDTAAGDFVPHSPLSMPYLEEQDANGQVCEEQSLYPDPVLMQPYLTEDKEYFDKLAEIRKLPTLDSDTATSPDIIQGSAADTILKASEFVLELSSYTVGKLLRKCSGILMEWSNGTGTILTTSRLIRSKSPNVDEWLGGHEYDLDAEVRVQFLHKDGFGTGKLKYLDKQYGFALFNVLMDEPKKLPRLRNEWLAQDVFLLGRYKSDLQIRNGKVLSKGAGQFQRHHYMYTDGHISPSGAGGAVINFEGDVTGMIAAPMYFIPSSTIQKCLEIWRTYDHVPRIHLGMKLLGIRCLDLVSIEKISRKYNVDAGLIVKQVSAKSNAEKLGVRMGDIILSVNGETIATAVELENKLLDVSKAQLEKGIVPGPNAGVTLVLGVLNTITCARGRLRLLAKLSNEEEIIEEGKHAVIYKRPNATPGVSS